MTDRVFGRFLLVGIGNTALGLAVIFIARQFLPDVVANAVGYLFVVPVSFLTHRDFSFRDTGSRLGAFARYLPAVGAGYTANLAALTTLLTFGINGYVAQTVAIAGHVAVTYTLSRLFVFLNFDRASHDTKPSAVS